MGNGISKKHSIDNNNNDIDPLYQKYIREMDRYRLSVKIDTSPSYLIEKQSEPFKIPITEGKVIKVINVGMVKVACSMKINEYEAKIYKFPIKIRGIFVPKPKSKEELSKHTYSKQELEVFVKEKNVVIKNVEYGNNGIVIADVRLDVSNKKKVDLKKWIIEKKLANEHEELTKPRKTSSSTEEYFDSTANVDKSLKKLIDSDDNNHGALPAVNLATFKRLRESIGRRNTC